MIAAVGFAFIAARPEWAAYIFLATMPFVGGIDRGSIIPLVRPSEAIQVGLTAAVLAGALYRFFRGEPITHPRHAGSIARSSCWPRSRRSGRSSGCSRAIASRASNDFFETLIVWRLAGPVRVVPLHGPHARAAAQVHVDPARGARRLLAVLAILDSLGIYKMGGIWTPSLDERQRRAAAARP